MKNSLKAVATTADELVVENYIVLFGGRDLYGEYFTRDTNFKSNYTETGLLHVDFEHGRDAEGVGNNGDNVLGLVDWKSAQLDDKGIFVKRVLNRRLDYVDALEELIELGLVGTSTEAIPDDVRKASTGEITNWPLKRDTLTVTPVEPRMLAGNVLTAAKALLDRFPGSRSLRAIVPAATRIKDIRGFEEFLREAGFPRAAAKAIAAGGWTRLNGQREVDVGADEVKALNWDFLQIVPR